LQIANGYPETVRENQSWISERINRIDRERIKKDLHRRMIRSL